MFIVKHINRRRDSRAAQPFYFVVGDVDTRGGAVIPDLDTACDDFIEAFKDSVKLSKVHSNTIWTAFPRRFYHAH